MKLPPRLTAEHQPGRRRGSIRLRSRGGLGGTILELLQERPGRIGRSEQFCTDAVGQQAHVEQRLGACPPALLPVKPILQVKFLAPAADGSPSGVLFMLSTPPARVWPVINVSIFQELHTD
jgi:hypothetical protein